MIHPYTIYLYETCSCTLSFKKNVNSLSCMERADDGLADAGLTFCGNHENMASQQSALYSQSHPGKQDMSAVTKVMMAH